VTINVFLLPGKSKLRIDRIRQIQQTGKKEMKSLGDYKFAEEGKEVTQHDDFGRDANQV